MRNSMQLYTGRIFPSILPQFASSMDDLFAVTSAPSLVNRAPSGGFDLEETQNYFLLSVDMPGVKAEDLKIELAENILTLSGERKRGAKTYGAFERTFEVPTSVDATRIEAQLSDGVLSVVLPKAEAAKPRTIKIELAKPGFLARILGQDKSEKDVTNPTDGNH